MLWNRCPDYDSLINVLDWKLSGGLDENYYVELRQHIQLLLNRYLRQPGIPDHPRIRAMCGSDSEEMLASKKNCNLRPQLLLEAGTGSPLLPICSNFKLNVLVPACWFTSD
jgi:hypothetical protein